MIHKKRKRRVLSQNFVFFVRQINEVCEENETIIGTVKRKLNVRLLYVCHFCFFLSDLRKKVHLCIFLFKINKKKTTLKLLMYVFNMCFRSSILYHWYQLIWQVFMFIIYSINMAYSQSKRLHFLFELHHKRHKIDPALIESKTVEQRRYSHVQRGLY